MKLTSKQENMIAAYLRDAGSQLERRMGPEERARRVSELQQQIQQRIDGMAKPVIEDADVEAVLRAAGQTLMARLDESAMRKRLNPQLKLMLTPDDWRWLGVCGGVAARYGMESWMVRVLFVLLALPLAPLVVLAYLGLYIWMYRQSDRAKLPKPRIILPLWRTTHLIFFTYILYYAAQYFHEFIYYAHTAFLKRDVPDLGEWDWIALWNNTFANAVLCYGIPLALLSGMPLRGGWGESLKRIPWALLALYFIGITFGIASTLVGIILDMVREFTAEEIFGGIYYFIRLALDQAFGPSE